MITKSPCMIRSSVTLPQVMETFGTWAATKGGLKQSYTMVTDYGPGHDSEAVPSLAATSSASAARAAPALAPAVVGLSLAGPLPASLPRAATMKAVGATCRYAARAPRFMEDRRRHERRPGGCPAARRRRR